MGCETCKEKEKQDNTLSFSAMEFLARKDRTIGRLIVAFAVTVVLLVGMFFLYLSQYDFVGESLTVDAKDGVANYIGNDGDIYNGEDYTNAPD